MEQDIKKLIVSVIRLKILLILRDPTYKKRLERLGLPTLEERRERKDLVTVYRVIKEMETKDRDDLLAWEQRN